jgi:hypothetical protein
MSANFLQIATVTGELVERKNAAYGSSFAKAGEFLQILYPKGIAPAQMADALLLVRIFDKQMRIATDLNALGENPYQDIIGYGILGVAMHQQEEVKPPCSGSASDQAARNTSPAPHDSAASPAEPWISATNFENSGSMKSPCSSASSANTTAKGSASPTSVPVSSAMGPADASTDVLVKALRLKSDDMCGWCGRLLRYAPIVEVVRYGRFSFPACRVAYSGCADTLAKALSQIPEGILR